MDVSFGLGLKDKDVKCMGIKFSEDFGYMALS